MTAGTAREASLLLRISELSDLLAAWLAPMSGAQRFETARPPRKTPLLPQISELSDVRGEMARTDVWRPDTRGSIAVAREASLLRRMSGYTISAHRRQLHYTLTILAISLQFLLISVHFTPPDIHD